MFLNLKDIKVRIQQKVQDSSVKIPAFRSLEPDSGVSVGRGGIALIDGSVLT